MKRFGCYLLAMLVAQLIMSSGVYAAIPAAERAALIALYEDTNGDSWTDNSGWKTEPLDADSFSAAGSEGSWFGVALNAGETNVEYVILYDNNLDGTIPSQLGNLTNLTRLSLANNQLTGSIPSELGNLANLEQLFLDKCQLAGNIPPELGNCTNLEWLKLGRNQLTGNIPSELGRLQKLETLDIFNNQLTGSIPAELGNLTNLKTLYLSINQLTGSIPSELGNLVNLETLNLSRNQLSGNIPAALGNFINLEWLFLNDNQLTGNIPTGIGNLTNLTQLTIYYNQLTGSIPAELGNLTSLQYLHIGNNRLAGPLPAEMLNLTSLPDGVLDIRNNYLFTDNNELRDFLNSKQNGGDWESSQGTPVQIPDVIDAAQSDAESSIEAAGLTVGETTTACSDTIANGNAIQSEPEAGSYLAPDSPVDLVISSGPCTSGDEPQDTPDDTPDSDGPQDTPDATPDNDGSQDTPDAAPDNAESVMVNGGQDTIQFQSADGTTITECASLDNPSPNDVPDNIELPYGFFQFTISDIAPGGSTVMTITLPADAAPTTYYKYGPTPDNPVDHWFEFLHDGSTGAMINGNVITLYFIDGQRGDSDLDSTNGIIEDPGAPAVANTVSPAAASDSGGGGGGCFIGGLTQ